VSMRALSPTIAVPVVVLAPQQRPMLQRTCGCGEHTGGGDCEECKKKKEGTLQQRHVDGLAAPAVAPPVVHEVLHTPGQPLLPATRAWAEPFFGRDLSGVRVHADEKAADSAKSVNALAYTVGQDVVFGRSQYEPMTRVGQKLLTHELAHTVQQAGSSNGPSPFQAKLDMSRPTDAAEHEAEAIAEQAEVGWPVRVKQRTSQFIHRRAREVAGDISIGLGAASAIGGAIALAEGANTGGGIALGLGIVAVLTGLALRSKPLPAPTSIRVVENHQVPLDADGVNNGWRTGYGGVTEIEVSNGNQDYDGSEIKEHFVRGHCENANLSGEGGTGGSTFTVGRGVSNNDLGSSISFPAKHNIFYDQHLVAKKDNVLPPGMDDDFSVCVQQYTFLDNQPIAGKSFLRRYDIHRDRIAGQDVAVLSLSTSEEGPSEAPLQPVSSAPADVQPPANTPGGQTA
jgi:hypothetical protein